MATETNQGRSKSDSLGIRTGAPSKSMFIQAGVKLRGNLTAITVLGKQGPSVV